MKKIIILGLILSLNLFAQLHLDNIASTMANKINEAIELVKTQGTKNALDGIYKSFDPIFDYELMAKLSLGSTQFNALDESQKQTYLNEYAKMLKRNFSDTLNSYSNQTMSVGELLDDKKRKILITKLISQEKTYEIKYKFYDAKEKGWLIYDIVIADISIVLSYKNQFANIIKDKGFKTLISLMQKNTKNDI